MSSNGKRPNPVSDNTNDDYEVGYGAPTNT
jgi:hypothetical protein